MSEDMKKKFEYDFEAFGIAIREEEFKEANIFANRIMSNAYLLDGKDFGVLGHILKEVANDGINILQSKEPKLIKEYTQNSIEFFGKITKMIETDSINLKNAWNNYSDHQDKTKLLFMSPAESKAYQKTDKSLSNKVIKKLMELLEKEIQILAYRPNNFFLGMLNEIGRVSKVNGLYAYDEHFVSLLRMIQKIDDYVKQTSSGSDFVTRSKRETIQLTEKIIQVYKSIDSKNQQDEKINELLWILIKIWRAYFIKFMEVGQVNYSMKEEQVPGDPERSKLVDEITKYIEKEIGV